MISWQYHSSQNSPIHRLAQASPATMTITQDSAAPLVAVVGATGKQGSSVVAGLGGSNKPYRVRGFTRDPSKPAAQILAEQGVEVVAVNVAAENADAVREAFRGVDIAFIMTTFWEHYSKEKEIEDGKMLIDAAHAAGAKRIIWSTLRSVEAASGGKYRNVNHFESKYQVAEYGRQKLAGTDVAFVSVEPGAYMQLFTSHNPIMMRKDEDNKVTLFLPISSTFGLGAIDIRDFGKFIAAAIEDPAYAHGGDMVAATEALTPNTIVAALSAATSKNFVFERASNDAYKAFAMSSGFPEHFAEQLVETFVGEEEYVAATRPAYTKISAPLTTFDKFIAGQNLSEAFA
ncbi:NAD(P)-binding protein [Auriculariales sp. MPI-PUGE-AT-0066]|nr:NAD(P)-binding protein [Auriculariales sp. MPI-PUGE-AT-0066]